MEVRVVPGIEISEFAEAACAAAGVWAPALISVGP